MITHALDRSMAIARPRKEVFAFFADAGNLERITPPELRFEILGSQPIRIATGTLIEYRLRLFGVPFGWKTRIVRFEPDDCFVDEQLRGPYRSFVHTHTFRDRGGGTEIGDHVRWALPFQPFGEIATPIVRHQLDKIFSFRERAIREIFAVSTGP